MAVNLEEIKYYLGIKATQGSSGQKPNTPDKDQGLKRAHKTGKKILEMIKDQYTGTIDDKLSDELELHITCHIIGSHLERYMVEDRENRGVRKFTGNYDQQEGFKSTFWGQMALTLDPSGVLEAMDLNNGDSFGALAIIGC